MNKKRYFLNTIAVLLIAAVAFLAYRSYSAPKAGSSSAEASDVPRLSTMKIVEVKVDEAQVQVAIEIVSQDETAVVADFVTLYRWGRTKFGPVKCGEGYPPEFCLWGEVHIFLIGLEEDVPTSAGLADVPMELLEFWLDQDQIDDELGPTVQLSSYAEIEELHNSVAQKTDGTGGGIEQPENKIFKGLE